VPRYLPEVLAEMWLVGESASQRYIAQRLLGLQHALRRQLYASTDQERVRRLAECAPEGAREVRFAELNERAQIRDKYRACNVTIDISTHLARLPGAQAPFPVWNRSRKVGINLVTQQRGCFSYRAVNRLSVINLTSGLRAFWSGRPLGSESPGMWQLGVLNLPNFGRSPSFTPISICGLQVYTAGTEATPSGASSVIIFATLCVRCNRSVNAVETLG
jgi:hypothetical protein